MSSKDRSKSRKKPVKVPTEEAKKLEAQGPVLEGQERKRITAKSRSISRVKAAISAISNEEPFHSEGVEAAVNITHDDLYTLKYDINEKGIGRILLPPSLSTLLQSDRICISPAAGGLFIKSL